MIEGDSCNFCGALLDAHCDAGEQQGDPRFCDLKTQYWTTDMSSDQMLDRLFEMTTPEQLQAADADVTRRMKTHRYTKDAPSLHPNCPVDAAAPVPDEAQARGEAAAARWLNGYRNGRDAT